MTVGLLNTAVQYFSI